VPDDEISSFVRFRSDDQRAAVEYLFATAETADPRHVKGTWVSITPVDPPDDALPDKRGFFGKGKKGQPPVFDIIFIEPGATEGSHMGTIATDGPDVNETLSRHGVAFPDDWKVDDNGTMVMIEVPLSTPAEEIVDFAVRSLTALLSGAAVQFDATLQG